MSEIDVERLRRAHAAVMMRRGRSNPIPLHIWVEIAAAYDAIGVPQKPDGSAAQPSPDGEGEGGG